MAAISLIFAFYDFKCPLRYFKIWVPWTTTAADSPSFSIFKSSRINIKISWFFSLTSCSIITDKILNYITESIPYVNSAKLIIAKYAFALIWTTLSSNKVLILGIIYSSTRINLPFSVPATLIIALDANSLMTSSYS